MGKLRQHPAQFVHLVMADFAAAICVAPQVHPLPDMLNHPALAFSGKFKNLQREFKTPQVNRCECFYGHCYSILSAAMYILPKLCRRSHFPRCPNR